MIKSKLRGLTLILAFLCAAALSLAFAFGTGTERAFAETSVAAEDVTGQKDSVEGAVTLSAFTMEEGAEVRKSGIVGLRFKTNVSAADLAELPNNAVFGTLLLPAEYLGAEELTIDTEKVLNVSAERWFSVEDDVYTYTAVLIGNNGQGLEESFYGVDIVARAYVSYEDASGTSHIAYADEAQTRSAAYVASAALANGESDEEGVLANIAGTVAKDFASAETNISVKAGETYKPQFTGDNGLVIRYETADPEIAMVENGEIKGVAEGSTTVTASIGTAEVVFNVEVTVTTLESETTAYDLIYNSDGEKSATLAVTCDGQPVDNEQISWESDAPAVVSVENGVITALASGSATVTATYDGATLDFTVTSWYGIYNTGDFQNMFVEDEDLNGNYKLMNDVILDSWIESQMYYYPNETADNLDFAHKYNSAYRLTGVFDGNNHTLVARTTRIFNGLHGGTLKNLTVITGRMGIWGGIFGYAMDNGALIDNVTVYTTLASGNHCGRVSPVGEGNVWYFAPAGALFYTASSSKISNTNVYVNIPADIDLTNGGAVTVSAIRGISTDAGSFEGGTMLQVENVNVYSTNTDIGFAGGMENAVQEWDGYVDIQTEADLDKYANSGLNFRLLNDLTIEFDGSVPSVNKIATLDSVFDGGGHTITINAHFNQSGVATHQNLIGTIDTDGVLQNATIIYNLIYENGVQTADNASMISNINNGTMKDLEVTFNFVEVPSLGVWFGRSSGYLSWGGTGKYEDLVITLTGSHLFLRGAEAPDSQYGRCGIVNATGDAATVTNMTIYGVSAEQPIGLLAPTWENIVNNIQATGLSAIQDIPE